jgi:flagellar biosynthesis GTPase FlhF
MEQAAPFAEQLEEAERELEVEDEPDAELSPPSSVLRPPEPEAPVRRFHRKGLQQAETIEAALVDSGLSARLAGEIVSETVAHLLPFGNTRKLRRLVRGELARRIPVQATASGPGRRIGFVGTGGAGKTLCAARLATAYAAVGDRPVACLAFRPGDGGAELTHLLAATGVPVDVVDDADEAWERIVRLGDDSVVVVDTPAVTLQEADQVEALAAELGRFLQEVDLTLPATISTRAAEELLAALSPLGVTHFALTHLDATSHIGGAVELAIRNAKPFSFTGRGTGMPDGLEPADPDAIASLLLP